MSEFSPEEIEKVAREIANEISADPLTENDSNLCDSSALWHLTQTASMRQEIEGLRRDKERLAWYSENDHLLMHSVLGWRYWVPPMTAYSKPFEKFIDCLDAAMQPAKEAK